MDANQKSVADKLDDTTQFALCVAAGVPIEYDFDRLTGIMTMRTARCCAVIEPEPGLFIVAVERAEPSEREQRERYIFGC
jgi:hypothetical protein